MRIATAMSEARRRLEEGGIENAVQEAGWLVSQLLGDNPVAIPCSNGAEFPPHLQAELDRRVQRRLDGEPLQYIMGDVDFHCVNLFVGPGVLIPRPETEQLVDIALDHLAIDGPVLDLCTGSGAIALAIAASRPSRDIYGTDISPQALEWAEKNRCKLHADNLTLLEGDLFQPLPPNLQFALITANPPYVSPNEYETLAPVVKDHEPQIALVAEDDGIAVLRRIAEDAQARLLPDGWLICEIGDQQGPRMADILGNLHYSIVMVQKDYAGHDRFAVAKR
ncbi:MAG: peptide chain release factor N(5)-glutamine methyltransferase [Lentisphaeria bacterium]|nr:peptide chain release factor N(5)-glutamine methyltransferase [Lentisphaeria bacterium]